MIDRRKHLTNDQNVCHGQMCAAGTRVLVTNILDNLAEGLTDDEILTSYPSLRREHIQSAKKFAEVIARP